MLHVNQIAALTATPRCHPREQLQGRADGFDITYRHPDAAFVNRWRMADNTLTWRIAARGGTGTETPFASYALHRTACEGARPPR